MDWDSSKYIQNASFVPQLGAAALELLSPNQGETILDLGCGDGQLTLKIAAYAPQVQVFPIDSSEDQVKAACERGLQAEVKDAQQLDYVEQFDAVFSNATIHWVKDQDAMLKGVYTSLKKGGRFVAEFGGFGNLAAMRTAIHTCLKKRGIDPLSRDPWFFATANQYKALLEKHNFTVEYIEIIPRQTLLPGHMRDWLGTFAGLFFKEMTEKEIQELKEEICNDLEPILKDYEGRWFADYVRLRVKAHKN